jgi:hypothetical protein
MLAFACLSWVSSVAVLSSAVVAVNPAVAVRGDTGCPTASAVGQNLAGLLPTTVDPIAPDVVELNQHAGRISVRLVKASGEVIADKAIPEALSCRERAATIAVMVAAWETRLRTEVPSLSLTTAPPSPSEAAPTSSPAPAPVALPRAGLGPTSPPTEVEAVVAIAPASDSRPLDIEAAAAILAAVSAGTLAPAAMVETSFFRRGAPFGLGLGALAVGSHATAVGPGNGVWRRLGGTADAHARFTWLAVELDLHAGVAFTALAISGQALPVTAHRTIFDPGAMAGLRARFRLGRVSPWLEAATALWPMTHRLYVDGTTSVVDLPVMEAFFGAGVTFGAGP